MFLIQHEWQIGWVEGGVGIPIYGFCTVVFGFEGWGDVCVYPEGPEGVVEVEDYHFWEGEAIVECFWTAGLFEESVWVGCVGCLVCLFGHLLDGGGEVEEY